MSNVANDCSHGSPPGPTRAAQYVRMSTDKQQYSPEAQKRAIAEYAVTHQMAVVAIYEDSGKSGLTLKSRPELSRLLRDVQSPARGFDVVLVYDVSRWGRFQDVDESAYYEFLCRRAGVEVVYCAESFVNDGTPCANIIKTVKRAMAGEYSRELSAKVYTGHCLLAERGFWQGSTPGYGLQRILVDAEGRIKGPMQRWERKSLQSDRVIIVPGQAHEIALVRRIFNWYAYDRVSPARIAARLNSFGLYNDLGHRWQTETIACILQNEKYIGTNIWGRTSTKLNSRWRRNPVSGWVRVVGAFEPVVDRETFEAAQAQRLRRTAQMTNDELASRLARSLERYGTLNCRTIDSDPGLPTAHTVTRRFGGLMNAYAAIGFDSPRPSQVYVETRRASQQTLDTSTDEAIAALVAAGRKVERSPDGTVICVDNELRVKFAARSIRSDCRNAPYWRVRWPARYPVDLLVVFRITPDTTQATSVYVFPRGSLPAGDISNTVAHRGNSSRAFDTFKFPDTRILLDLTARCDLENAHGILTASQTTAKH